MPTPDEQLARLGESFIMGEISEEAYHEKKAELLASRAAAGDTVGDPRAAPHDPRDDDHTAPQPLGALCPLCGARNEPRDTFRCTQCDKDHLCRTHAVGDTRTCENCVAEREEAQRRLALHLATVGNSVRMTFRLVQPGTFLMGSESDDSECREMPVHPVTLSSPFFLAACPVTQAEYERVTRARPSLFSGPNRPVELVSWDDATAFCRTLSDVEGVAYRLPTEAEWEYACRAGSAAEYCFGDEAHRLDEYAWHLGNSNRQTHDVGQKKPNAWGLHDMHGNVWEWCQDWYGSYPAVAQADPTGPASGDARVLRGGSWSLGACSCRCASRLSATPDRTSHSRGFRVVRAVGVVAGLRP